MGKSSARSLIQLAFKLLSMQLLLCVAAGQAATLDDYNRVKEQAFVVMSQADSQKAIDLVISRNTVDDAMKIFMLMARDLYWQHKNLSAALVIGRAGIQLSLIEAQRVRSTDSAQAYRLSSQAQMLAYDLSSYCWPGWREEGISIPEFMLLQGQDLAKTNLRLAQELRKGDLPMSHAWWLVGAHHLAIGQYERARKAFVEASKFAIAAQTRETELLLKGYLYLAELMLKPNNQQLLLEFEFVLKSLNESQEGTFFRNQLETAKSVFSEQTLAEAETKE